MESAPAGGAGFVACDVILVGGACACVLGDGAGSDLPERQGSAQWWVSGCLWGPYAFGKSL